MDAAALDDLATATDDEAYSARVRRRVQAGVFVAACLSLAGSAFIAALLRRAARARTSQSFYIVHLAAADGVLAVSDLLRPRPRGERAFRAMTRPRAAQAFLHAYGEALVGAVDVARRALAAGGAVLAAAARRRARARGARAPRPATSRRSRSRRCAAGARYVRLGLPVLHHLGHGLDALVARLLVGRPPFARSSRATTSRRSPFSFSSSRGATRARRATASERLALR